jgi:hypothetical protein
VSFCKIAKTGKTDVTEALMNCHESLLFPLVDDGGGIIMTLIGSVQGEFGVNRLVLELLKVRLIKRNNIGVRAIGLPLFFI